MRTTLLLGTFVGASLYALLRRAHPPSHFGEHLMIDGRECPQNLLNDPNLVKQALTEIPAKLGMNILGGPEVYWAEGNGLKDSGGPTGICAIQESHLSIHAFPARRFFTADVYTCQHGLDIDLIGSLFYGYFQFKHVEVRFTRRGTHFPKHDIVH